MFDLLPLTPASRPAVQRFILDRWGTDFVVAHGQVYYPHELPGFAALDTYLYPNLTALPLADSCHASL